MAAERGRRTGPARRARWCGEIDIVIGVDGRWRHEGAVIERPALVRLFASILQKEPSGYYLVTPVEKMRIRVEDAPFVAVAVTQTRCPYGSPVLSFVTNLGEEVQAGRDHPIRIITQPDGTPRPYLHVRDGLDALIARPVFYELVSLAAARPTSAGPQLGVSSNDVWFPLGYAEPDRIYRKRTA